MYKKFSKFFLVSSVLVSSFFPSFIVRASADYDIVYVRYPAQDPNDPYVTIPQGEHPYKIAAGADLILLHPDGSEDVLVDCNECSVMDPFISLDANWVYYSLIEEATEASASWIYKINLKDPQFTPIRLSFGDGFDSHLYAANTTEKHYQSSTRKIRDMAPIPLADGRILFTSNRAGLTALNPETDAVVRASVQQLYTMSDHDGTANNKELSNVQRLETGNLHAVQHPIQLMDGRILFSSWQDIATKYRYAMTSLFTVNPDGTNLKQFTEPHDHHRNVEHFITQLADEDQQVVSTLYYPSFDFGFGILKSFPIDPDGPDFLRGKMEHLPIYGANKNASHREFDRKETRLLTYHTTPQDIPAPAGSGKYSMPSATKNNALLVAYSSGYVNHFPPVCAKNDECEGLKSGIYIIPNAADSLVGSPEQLIKVKDDPNYNEIWPRAVLSYQDIYGISRPNLKIDKAFDKRLKGAEATAIVGTSSMYNREPLEGNKADLFQDASESRTIHDGNWTIQGAEAGVFSNSDIYGVRIIGTPAKPYTKPIVKNAEDTKEQYNQIQHLLSDERLSKVVARYSSLHSERWEILGEFPLTNKGVVDQQGNPDTSWAAKIPAETPFLIQALDKNGMTLNSELTWRALKPGEVRTDCGGCHAHSIEPLDFHTTQAGLNAPIKNVIGVENTDPRIKNGLWDLTQGSIPMLSGNGVVYSQGGVTGVEFNRDITPILENSCVTCHTQGGVAEALVLDGGTGLGPYETLTNRDNGKGGKYKIPQRSRYIRVPQARQSLLTWVVYRQRLDGRTNETRDADLDYTVELHNAHKDLNLTDKDKRTVARWIDLGSPIDFPQTDGMGYTDDNQLPIVNLQLQEVGDKAAAYEFAIGVHDVHTGIDWSTVKVAFASADDVKVKGVTALDTTSDDCAVQPMQTNHKKGLVSYSITKASLVKGKDYVFSFEIKDKVGNKNIATHRFTHPL